MLTIHDVWQRERVLPTLAVDERTGLVVLMLDTEEVHVVATNHGARDADGVRVFWITWVEDKR